MNNLLTCVKAANYGCYVGLGAIHIYKEPYCKVHKTIYIPFYLEEKKVLYFKWIKNTIKNPEKLIEYYYKELT